MLSGPADRAPGLDSDPPLSESLCDEAWCEWDLLGMDRLNEDFDDRRGRKRAERLRRKDLSASCELVNGPCLLRAHIDGQASEALASNLLFLDEVEERVVHANPHDLLELRMGSTGLGYADEICGRPFQSAGAREPHATVVPCSSNRGMSARV